MAEVGTYYDSSDTKTMIFKKLKVPLYHNELWVLITPKREDAVQWCKKRKMPCEWGTCVSGITLTSPGCYPFIWVPGIKKPEHVATMNHELVHAAWFILQDAGVKIAHDNHEALTYLIGDLTRQILK